MKLLINICAALTGIFLMMLVQMVFVKWLEYVGAMSTISMCFSIAITIIAGTIIGILNWGR